MESHMIKRIHINQHHIKHNAKNSDDKKDVITVKTSSYNHYCSEVTIHGNSTLVYSPEKPLSCGAKVWLETSHGVTLKNKNNDILSLD